MGFAPGEGQGKLPGERRAWELTRPPTPACILLAKHPSRRFLLCHSGHNMTQYDIVVRHIPAAMRFSGRMKDKADIRNQIRRTRDNFQ